MNSLRVHADHGAFTPEEIAATNRRHDEWYDWKRWMRKTRPDWMVRTPPGFDKNLDDESLSQIVWESIVADRELKLEKWRGFMATQPNGESDTAW